MEPRRNRNSPGMEGQTHEGEQDLEHGAMAEQAEQKSMVVQVDQGTMVEQAEQEAMAEQRQRKTT